MFTTDVENLMPFADGFPETIVVTQELLDHHESRFMRRDGERLYFSVESGDAEYVIVGYSLIAQTYSCARLYVQPRGVA